MKSNKKNHIILVALILLVLCAGVITGIKYFSNRDLEEVPATEKEVASDRTKSTKYKYTIMVKDKAGNPVKGALAAFYDTENNMVSLPLATNSVGSAVHTVREEGNYGVGLLSVPFRYVLDSEIRSFAAGETTIKVVLEDNPNAYVAQIGDQKYVFEDAIAYANASTEDVTITLLGNLRFSAVTINNEAGKKITIDGNGHTITTLGGGNAIAINQKSGTVEFKNMTIDHKNSGQIFKANYGITLNLENMKLLATHDQENAYIYCLINFMGAGTSNLNMEKVDVVMATTSKASGSGAGVIRTGNTDTEKHVNITMKNCNLDTTGAAGRSGIVVMENTTSNLKLSGTKIMTKDAYAIRPNGQNLTYSEDCKFGSEDAWYNAHPIEWLNAVIGNKKYTLAKALKVANESTEDVTIKMVGDLAVWNGVTIKNVNGKNITIDGGGYTLYLGGTSHALRVAQLAGTVTFENMNINHSGSGMLMRIGQNRETDNSTEVLAVNLNNVDIASTSIYKYCLVGTQDYKTFNVNMTDVNVDWDKEETYASSAFLRVGGGTDYVQTLNLTMTDCLVDVSGAGATQGFYMVKKTEGAIDLNNTTIITAGSNIYTNSGKIKIDADAECEFSTNGGTPVAKIGSETYLSLLRALEVANTSTEDVTIEILGDIVTQMPMTIANANGKNITVKGAGYKLEAKTTTDHVFNVDQLNGTVTIEDLDIVHSGNKMLMCIGQNRTTDQSTEELTVNLNNMDVKSTSTYQYCLVGTQDYKTFHVNMTGVNVDWDKEEDYASSAFIRIGGGTDKAQTINLTMTDCIVDVSGAKPTQGMYMVKNTEGTVDLINTTFITATDVDTYTNKGNLTITESDGTPVAKIGNEVYFSLPRAVAVANASTEDVTIQLMDDIELTSDIEINNENGKNITIDGQNGEGRYKLTSAITSDHAIKVHQKSGAVTFQKLDIEHGGTKMLMRVGEDTYVAGEERDLQVKLLNMDIISDSTYTYCLIATQALGQFDIDMENVDVLWTGDHTSSGARAFLRCGKDANNPQTVDVDMTGCTIDVSSTTKTQGMYICNGVSGTVDFVDTDITTPGAKMYTGRSSVTVTTDDDCTFTYKVDIDEEFTTALTNANASAEDVTIKLVADIELTDDIEINNTNGKTITIDGQNGEDRYTLTLKDTGAHSIRVYQSSGTVAMQNLNISHDIATNHMLMRIGDGKYTVGKNVTVRLQNMDITSNSPYQYCLVATQDINTEDGKFDIDMENVNVTWNKDDANQNVVRAFLRCGDGSNDQTVDVSMKDCRIDLSQTTKTQGMYICEKADVIVSTYENVTLITPEGIGGYTHEAKSEAGWIQALTFANASKEDGTIKITGNFTTDEAAIINNASGKSIRINGQNKTLTLKHRFDVQQQNGVIVLQDLVVKHSGSQMFMRIGSNETAVDKSQENVTVNLNNIKLTSESAYKYCLIGTQDHKTIYVNMEDVTVDWNDTSERNNRAFIRCGINDENDEIELKQKLSLKMEGCEVDVSDAGTTRGIYILETVIGTIELKNTKIITKGVEAYKVLATEELTFNKDADCAFTCMAGNSDFVDAVNVANSSTDDIAIKLTENVSITSQLTISNENNKNITIDGQNGENRFQLTSSTRINLEQEKGTVTIENLDIVHSGSSMMLRIGSDFDEEKQVVVKLCKMNIVSTSIYQYCLIGTQDLGTVTINMDQVHVTWSKDDTNKNADRAFLRLANDGNQQNVNVKMQDCLIALKETTKTNALFIANQVTGNIELQNTTINTNSTYEDGIRNKSAINVVIK